MCDIVVKTFTFAISSPDELFLLLGRIAATASDSGLLLHTEESSVVSLCVSVGHARKPLTEAEPIEMLFGGAESGGSKESCISWGPIPQGNGQCWG